MKLSHQTEFYIDGEELVTLKEIKGFPVEFYKDSLIKLAHQEEENNVLNLKINYVKKRSRSIGWRYGLLSSNDDARELLENIFLLDNDPKS